MTNVTITIGGSVINSPIAVADVITGSFNTLVESRASDGLKDWLTELHKAIPELATKLPADEAALAARDLEDLTKEATAPKPRPAFWRGAADGLVAAANRVVDVGGPVVDLVAKVVALLPS